MKEGVGDFWSLELGFTTAPVPAPRLVTAIEHSTDPRARVLGWHS